MRISILRENLVNRYKSKFTPNPKGQGYIYYASETANGYLCTEQKAKEYIDKYAKVLKKYSRLMILWIVLMAIGMGVIQGFEIYVFRKFEMVMYFILPLPIVITKVMQVYNAPKALQRGKQISGVRDRKEIMNARIQSINPSMIYMGLGVSILGVYFIITGDEFANKIVYTVVFSLLILFFLYILWRKNKISNEELKILNEQKNQNLMSGIQYVSLQEFKQDEELFFSKATKYMPRKTRIDFWNKIEKLDESDFRIFEVLHCNTINKGHTAYHVDWKDADTMFYTINEINKVLKLGEYEPSHLHIRNDLILENYNDWLLEKEHCLWQIDHGGDFFIGFVTHSKDI
ncbi:hypothetical protein [Aquimarina sp. AU474]|uniref:DUF6630 family protein n=1 Tax=Aquimarina sp. AU474 TaxID=2108529 RepID=UPI000D69E888|nr:hypothetical protein [Aquimarina sp. AU474]